MYKPSHKEGHSEPTNEQIIEALNLVLDSDKFTAAPQMSAFLRYVVEQAASGNMTRIKAYTVAIDALGKPDTFDPQNDPVVRVLAGRLRAALASYYETNPSTDVQIMMRPGTYVPAFKLRPKTKAADNPVAELQHKSTPFKSTSHSQLDSASSQQDRQEIGKLPNSTENNTSPSEHGHNFEPDSAEGSIVESSPVPPANEKKSFSFGSLLRLPATSIALGILGLLVGMQLTQFRINAEANQAIAAPLLSASISTPERYRPEKVSLFVSQSSESNNLKDQVNTMISSVFSESEELRVFRLMETERTRQHWPEDYLVAVDILPLSSETRVSVQLVEAQTGRISHSQNLTLSKMASEGISDVELNAITEFAKELIGDEGPLFRDYRNKEDAIDTPSTIVRN